MSEIVLPAPIQTFVDATNRGDSSALLEAFIDDPVLEDGRRTFVGREGIVAWNRHDNIGQQAHFEVVTVTAGAKQDSYVVTVRVTSAGYNGTSPITFELRENRINRLTIPGR